MRIKKTNRPGYSLRLKNPLVPKRVPNPYAMYLQERLKLRPVLNSREEYLQSISIISKDWRELPDAEKQKYIDIYREKSEERAKLLEKKVSG
ncbi:hypothetical protein AX774_g7292 [Zancudomyces culisetae]|uniref:HMG box domain-containing protein n=1 Tax=Zancudomyces culisetae TaxID=1213189 RepID=A0A1R1PEF4_ZANCU|nr:hypothetical protein AX774_g7292 [Zancudomyces culisetae]|eukprot:OMH79298.1 hypothetical protein AX774_g7292 [Zancudomyces culisetae]